MPVERQTRRCSTAIVVLAAIIAVVGRSGVTSAAPVKVFVLAGQSNAVGYGAAASQLPPALSAPQTDVRFWWDISGIFFGGAEDPHTDSGDMFVPLAYQSHPTAFGSFVYGITEGFGPEITLGRTLADGLVDDIAIVKYAIGASNLAVHWNPDTPGSFYDRMTDDVVLALVALDAMGHTGRVSGFVWMQGESDAQVGAHAAAYEANLTALVQRVRTDFGEPALPVVFGRISANLAMSTLLPYPFLDTVRAAQEAVAASVPGTVMIDTDDLPMISDFIHFTAAGQLTLGQRFAAPYLASVCGDGVLDLAEQCDDGNQTSGDGCDANCTPTGCGNGIVTAGEACDDGNTTGGDCCSPSCQPPVCKVPTEPFKSQLVLKDKTPDTGDVLAWKWTKGEATALADLGDPVAADGYTLCISSSSPAGALLLEAHAPAGGLCNDKPCWRAAGTKGFRYKDKERTPDGLDKLGLVPGAEGKAKVIVKGKGQSLALPALPLAPPLQVRLVAAGGACWQATFSAAGVTKNDAGQFKAKSD